MRYRLFGTVRGRNLLICLLVLLALPFILNSCIKIVSRSQNMVAPNVHFEGRNLGGLNAREVVSVVEQIAQIRLLQPVDTIVDPVTKGVIPGLNGVEIDREKTTAKILAAKKGETVTAVYRQLPPSVTMDHFKEFPVYQGNPAKPQVAFIINVAWGNEYLDELLDVLKEAQAQATFFLVGRWVNANQEEAKAIADAGFEIASHGYSDALSMQHSSKDIITEDVSKAAQIISSVCGRRPVYFSPHRGELSPLVLSAAAEQNLRVVMWTVDTVDWKLPGVGTMVEKVANKAGNGSLILMHPTEQTADFLRRIIPILTGKGLEPVTLTRLLDPSMPFKE